MPAGRLGGSHDRATVMEAAATAAGVAGGLAGSSRVRLRTLSQRRDRDGWVIGRPETGDFISIPDVAHRVITLLGEGLTVDEVSARLRAETGTRFAVADFVAALDELGFVGSVDDLLREDRADTRPSLPWLRPEHVRWLLHPLAPIVVAGFAAAGVIMLALHPALLPSYHVLVWSRRVGLVLAINAAIGWTLVLLHELAHLATARGAGAPSRITLSTRLQFLVAQTDVSGVWAAPRRNRITVYLAGIAANLCLAGAFLLVLGLANPHGVLRSLLAVAVAETVLMLATQLMVFMRTDLLRATRPHRVRKPVRRRLGVPAVPRAPDHPALDVGARSQPGLPRDRAARDPAVQRRPAGRHRDLPRRRRRGVGAGPDRSPRPGRLRNRRHPRHHA
jgi:putative peptide zinc metalloprotease protein